MGASMTCLVLDDGEACAGDLVEVIAEDQW